jgi:uncharacterized Zn finger protein
MTCPDCSDHPVLTESINKNWPHKVGVKCDGCGHLIDFEIDSTFFFCPNAIVKLTDNSKYKCTYKYAVCAHCATKNYVEKKLELKTE